MSERLRHAPPEESKGGWKEWWKKNKGWVTVLAVASLGLAILV